MRTSSNWVFVAPATSPACFQLRSTVWKIAVWGLGFFQVLSDDLQIYLKKLRGISSRGPIFHTRGYVPKKGACWGPISIDSYTEPNSCDREFCMLYYLLSCSRKYSIDPYHPLPSHLIPFPLLDVSTKCIDLTYGLVQVTCHASLCHVVPWPTSPPH